jgi:elongation factor Ts
MMTTPITPSLIKELRERTGVGMGKCKEALEEAKGDIELAIDNLRKAGIAGAVKKEGRSTNEGQIASAVGAKNIALVEINAETDFVVKNDRFQEFLKNIVEEIAATNPASLESFLNQKYSKDQSLTIDQYRATVIQAIGENIQIKRLMLIPKSADKSIGVYSHLGGKIVTVVEIQGSANEEQLAKDIAMHVAAAAPEYLSPEKVPQSVIENEREIAKVQIKGKPDNIVEKIVDGKIKAYFDANCLVCQKYIRDDAKTITEVVAEQSKKNGQPLQLVNFIRWNVGSPA